jgi:hypothetical protein
MFYPTIILIKKNRLNWLEKEGNMKKDGRKL